MSKSCIDSSIENALRFISDNINIIKGIYKHVSYNDEPKLYGYSVSFKNNYGTADGEADAGGLSFNQDRALIRALGEAIERFSLGDNNEKQFIYKTFHELVKLHKSVVDPKTLISIPHNNKYNRDVESSKFHWVEGEFLSSHKKVFVPAQSVYTPYVNQTSEPVLSFPISTGAAAGTNISEALYRGICEVVERDSFMIAYLNKLPSPHVDLYSMNEQLFANIVETYRRYNLELIVLDLTTNLQIPAFAAIILDRTGIGPAVSVGLKAGFNSSDAILGAIEEAQMVRFYTRGKIPYKAGFKKNNEITTIEERAQFWSPISMIKQLDFWLNSKTYKNDSAHTRKSSEDYLKKAVTLLDKRGVDIIYVDITDKLVKKYGFTVVKVIIPKLQPLYLDERYQYIQKDRIYNTPVEMGYYKKPKQKKLLNQIPHPFL